MTDESSNQITNSTFTEIVRLINIKVTNVVLDPNFNRNDYEVCNKWTFYFDKIIEEIITGLQNPKIEIYSSLNYEAKQLYLQRESRKLDYSIWQSKHKAKTSRDIWKYDVLIEHENNGELWLQELQKLASIKAPYKLIITYGMNEESKNGLKGIGLLGQAADIIDFIGYEEKEEIVVMIGADIKDLKEKDIKMIYNVYKFDKKKKCFEPYSEAE